MLVKHIVNNDKILVLIDVDCDGYTSSALLLNYLHKHFAAFVENNIIYITNEGKQHGIILETIPDDVKLVIAPDSSSNSYEEHKALKERGVDVLVIDHHQASEVSQDACIINNQLCDYPNKTLSGVGMVWKFCCAFDTVMNTDYAQDMLDLVALGLIADMIDLRDFETRHLITKGLGNIKNPYLSETIGRDSFHFTEGITPIGVAFYIAPLINAMTRIGDNDEKMLLFESMLDYKAYEQIPSTKRGCRNQTETRVEQACRTCSNIKNKQTKVRDETTEMVENIISENNLLNNKILIITIENASYNRVVTGLIANQLMSKYQRPVLLLNRKKDAYEGSGRGYPVPALMDFRSFVENTHLVNFAEGHPNAFGCSIDADKIDEFISFTNNELSDVEFNPTYEVDFILNSKDVNAEDIINISGLKCLWGQGVEEAKIAVEGLKIHKDNIFLMSPNKNPTLKILMPNGISLLKFKSSEEEYNNLYSESGYVAINLVGTCERNVWNNRISPQIMIEAYEITERASYYF